MLKLGSLDPRALQCFGVTGLLGADCQVYYSSLFSLKHVGKVSDLLAARLRGSTLDELRLRTLLLFGAFEACRAQRQGEPVTVECGIDEEKIAIGVAFTLPREKALDLAQLEGRVAAGKPDGEFEKLLLDLHRHSDQLVLRAQEAQGRYEIVSLLMLPAKAAASEGELPVAGSRPMQVIRIEGEGEAAPEASEYTELGDLDYPKLLEEDDQAVLKAGKRRKAESKKVKGAPSEPESVRKVKGGAQDADEAILVSGDGSEGGDEDSITVQGGQDADESAGAEQKKKKASKKKSFFSKILGKNKTESDVEEKQNVSSDPELELLEQTISGKDAPSDNPAVHLKGDKGKAESGTYVVHGDPIVDAGAGAKQIKGAASKAEGDGAVASEKSKAESKERHLDDLERRRYEVKIRELETKVAALQRGLESGTKSDSAKDTQASDAVVVPGSSPDSAQSAEAAPGQGIKKLFGKVWPFKKKIEPAPETDSTFQVIDDPSTGAVKKKTKSAKAALNEGVEDASDEPIEDAAANSLLQEIRGGHFDQLVSRVQKESADIKNELTSAKAKQWIDGFMGELIAEKARLHEMAKKLNASIRQKENEYKKRQAEIQSEVKTRDDLIRQKSYALGKSKEQLMQLTTELNNLKANSKMNGADGIVKQKLNHVQKMLSSAKDENAVLNKKLEDLKTQLTVAQQQAKARVSTQSELAGLQAKLDRAQRQAEEFKRTNQQLADQLNEAKRDRGSSGASVDDLKKRLEAAVKIMNVNKKENDRLTSKLDEMRREEMKLKMELARAQTELKAAKAAKASALKPGAAKPGAGARPAAAKPGVPVAGTGGGSKGNPPKAA